MSQQKPGRRKSAPKLDPIDWKEFANDAVLKGNMSTLFRRPANEDASSYASAEALVEIEKRGPTHTAPSAPTVGTEPIPAASVSGPQPTVGPEPAPATLPTVGSVEDVGFPPPVGFIVKRRARPVRTIEDALTLAGQILYRALYGPAGNESRTCSKGYRQLAAETHLDKDTVRDLIAEFKEKGILRETGRYDPDTRTSKTYEVFSPAAILTAWRKAGLHFVTTGRQRPTFCDPYGQPLTVKPTLPSKPPA